MTLSRSGSRQPAARSPQPLPLLGWSHLEDGAEERRCRPRPSSGSGSRRAGPQRHGAAGAPGRTGKAWVWREICSVPKVHRSEQGRGCRVGRLVWGQAWALGPGVPGGVAGRATRPPRTGTAPAGRPEGRSGGHRGGRGGPSGHCSPASPAGPRAPAAINGAGSHFAAPGRRDNGWD